MVKRATSFIRKGIVGDYGHCFTQADLELLRDVFGEEASYWGYTLEEL